jgi:hypothetical protein
MSKYIPDEDVQKLVTALKASFEVEPLLWGGPFPEPPIETRTYIVTPEGARINVSNLLYVMRNTERMLWKGAVTVMLMTALAQAGAWPPSSMEWARAIPVYED